MKLFECKTKEGYSFKVLAELLQNVIKFGCFEFSEKGINLRMMDSRRTVLLNVELPCHSFNMYSCSVPDSEPLIVGLTTSDLHRMLKNMKKKDSLHMYIDSESPKELKLVVQPRENVRLIISSVHIQDTQYIKIPLPQGYQNPVIVPSAEYQRSIKDMHNIDKSAKISLRTYSMTIFCSTDNVVSREIRFGDFDADTSPIYYSDIFSMDQFVRIMKIAGLGPNLKISAAPDMPLKISSQIGNLGTIDIFIKSKRDQAE